MPAKKQGDHLFNDVASVLSELNLSTQFDDIIYSLKTIRNSDECKQYGLESEEDGDENSKEYSIYSQKLTSIISDYNNEKTLKTLLSLITLLRDGRDICIDKRLTDKAFLSKENNYADKKCSYTANELKKVITSRKTAIQKWEALWADLISLLKNNYKEYAKEYYDFTDNDFNTPYEDTLETLKSASKLKEAAKKLPAEFEKLEKLENDISDKYNKLNDEKFLDKLKKVDVSNLDKAIEQVKQYISNTNKSLAQWKEQLDIIKSNLDILTDFDENIIYQKQEYTKNNNTFNSMSKLVLDAIKSCKEILDNKKKLREVSETHTEITLDDILAYDNPKDFMRAYLKGDFKK